MNLNNITIFNKKQSQILLLMLSFLLSGCNLATSSSGIAPSYTSNLAYTNFDCPTLNTELQTLIRREEMLSVAQDQRHNSSVVQAVILGFGQGDGVEASELASVKGQKEAVRHAIDTKACLIGGLVNH